MFKTSFFVIFRAEKRSATQSPNRMLQVTIWFSEPAFCVSTTCRRSAFCWRQSSWWVLASWPGFIYTNSTRETRCRDSARDGSVSLTTAPPRLSWPLTSLIIELCTPKPTIWWGSQECRINRSTTTITTTLISTIISPRSSRSTPRRTMKKFTSQILAMADRADSSMTLAL